MRIIVGGIVVVAWMMPAVTAGMTWYASTTGGALGTLTGLHNTNFLDSQPLVVVTIANVWSMTGFSMLVMGAALRNIPCDAIEAAMVENASSWQRFRKIVLPLMRPTMIAVVLLDGVALAGQLRADLHHDPGRPGQRDEHLAPLLLPAGLHATTTSPTAR